MTENELNKKNQQRPQQKPASKIQFKPLHEGMGFHPFSDGLPYAPESKTKFSSGAGAMSAGRPQFVTGSGPTVSSAGTSKTIGTARQLQQKNNPQTTLASSPATLQAELKSDFTGGAGAYARNQKPVQKTAPKQPSIARPSGTPIPTAEMASPSVLRRRVFAYLMDTIIHAGFWISVNLAALFLFHFQIDSEILKDNFSHFLLFFLVSQWMFVALQEMLFENSIGKFFFNLEFKRNHGSLLLRSIVFMGGLLCFGLGLYFRPQDKLGRIQLKSKLYEA